MNVLRTSHINIIEKRFFPYLRSIILFQGIKGQNTKKVVTSLLFNGFRYLSFCRSGHYDVHQPWCGPCIIRDVLTIANDNKSNNKTTIAKETIYRPRLSRECSTTYLTTTYSFAGILLHKNKYTKLHSIQMVT